jgi:hypothetical protein
MKHVLSTAAVDIAESTNGRSAASRPTSEALIAVNDHGQA